MRNVYFTNVEQAQDAKISNNIPPLVLLPFEMLISGSAVWMAAGHWSFSL